MIKEVKMYTVICNNCGSDVCEDAEYSCWNEISFAENIAMEDDWIKEGDKHYCPDCFTYDDDDNLVIKEKSGSTDR
jgi:hypothetical protein